MQLFGRRRLQGCAIGKGRGQEFWREPNGAWRTPRQPCLTCARRPRASAAPANEAGAAIEIDALAMTEGAHRRSLCHAAHRGLVAVQVVKHAVAHGHRGPVWQDGARLCLHTETPCSLSRLVVFPVGAAVEKLRKCGHRALILAAWHILKETSRPRALLCTPASSQELRGENIDRRLANPAPLDERLELEVVRPYISQVLEE